MKTIKLIIIAIFAACNANAQIKVLANGNCGIGTTSPETRLDVRGGSLQMYDRHNIYLNEHQGYNDPGDLVFLNNGTESGRIWRYGSGMYIRTTTGGYGAIRIQPTTENVAIGYSFSSSYKLIVGGDLYVTGEYQGSDIRFKKNIESITNPVVNILQLQGIKYEYDIDKINAFRREKYNSLVLKDSLTPSSEFGDKVNEACLNIYKMGFIAQDFRKVFPDLVKVDEDSILSIDYIGLIPVLVEAIKEQQARIEALERIISRESLKSATNSASNNLGEKTDNVNNSVLYQNEPNPFYENTIIEYILGEGVNSAVIYIYDINGIQIKSIPLFSEGKGSITINGNEFKAGMYIYTLIVDGQTVDTKTMILTK